MVMSAFGAEWQIALAIGCAVLLIVWQAQHVSRRRMIAAALVILVAVSYQVLFAGDIYILDPCAAFVKYSWEWWLYGCWSLPG